MADIPPFPVTTVGSWPRPEPLLRAMKRRSPDLAELQDAACLESMRLQLDAGVDIVTDGEQRRDNFYSFLAERVEGFECLSMADLLEHVEDKAGFETLLQTLDVPAYAMKNNVAVGKLRAVRPLAMEDFDFLRRHTDAAIKVTLPGPYLLSRSSWVKALSSDAYPTREALADDVVALLRAELIALAEAGADVVQLDEPVLTELVFAGKSSTHTFMCAALAATADPAEELAFAVELINRVVDGVDGCLRAMHVCRGNWSRDEDVLLAGSYDDLIPYFREMKVDQFVLEYATERAGDPALLAGLPETASVGFGVVNPRTDEIEDPRAIAERVRTLARDLGHDRIHLNPDCGFGTFAERPMATVETAVAKLRALSAAAALLRSGEV